MIAFYQHVWPYYGFLELSERQRARIRKALGGEPHRIITCECESERVTLKRMWLDARDHGADQFAYLHLKGLTKTMPSMEDWRELLEYFMIDCWQEAKIALESGYDLVGCNHSQEPWPHFSGNFFWMRSEVAHWLRSPELEANPERWVLSANCPLNVRELHHSGVNHYQERYPVESYR